MYSSFPILTTERLLLRRFAELDLENLFYGLSHPDVIRYYGISLSCIGDAKNQLTWIYEIENNNTGFWWVISSRDSQEFYGAVGLYFLKPEHEKAELGFWLLPQFWRKGFAGEAIKKITDYGFSHMQLHRIEAQVEKGNADSERILNKAAFTCEGTLRDYEKKNGHFISLDIFSKLTPLSLSFQTQSKQICT